MRGANSIEEEFEVAAVVVDDRKIACDICEKRYINGLNTIRKKNTVKFD